MKKKKSKINYDKVSKKRTNLEIAMSKLTEWPNGLHIKPSIGESFHAFNLVVISTKSIRILA